MIHVNISHYVLPLNVYTKHPTAAFCRTIRSILHCICSYYLSTYIFVVTFDASSCFAATLSIFRTKFCYEECEIHLTNCCLLESLHKHSYELVISNIYANIPSCIELVYPGGYSSRYSKDFSLWNVHAYT